LSDQHKLFKLKDSLFADLQHLPDKLSALVEEMQDSDIIFLLRILTNLPSLYRERKKTSMKTIKSFLNGTLLNTAPKR
ncbi:MAG: hypothetical protein SPH01_00930, partial [Prevotella sp.]|nr:hypothetical protein [Prevotella sp.]